MRKPLFLLVFVLLLLQSTTVFAAGPSKTITVIHLNSKPGVTQSIYKTVYLTTQSFKNIDYLPAKAMAEAFGMDAKWYVGKNIFALNANNIFAAVSLSKYKLVIKKNNRLHTLAIPVVEKNSVLQLPVSILQDLNIKSNKGSTIYYIYPSVLKHVYEKKLDAFVKENDVFLTGKSKSLSQYTTHFNSGTKNRTANIYQASHYINGLIIPPGQVFSFNKTLGPRNKSTGYKKAIIFSNKEKIEDYGGGICQVSSTIYNAVYRSKLPVLQRKSHSLDVTYVPKGMDATVSYGYIDFVFKNNKPFPIVINTEPRGNHLTVKLSMVRK